MRSSEENDANTDKCSATQKNPDMDDKLEDLSCPFTWGMKNVIENRNKLLDASENRFVKVVDIEEHFPEFVLVYHLMLACEHAMSNDDESAMESINNAEQSLADIKQKEALKNAGDVLQHIFFATKCHLLQKLERETEVDDLLQEIPDIDDMNEVELAMLSGCQCLGWTLCYATDNLKAIECAKKAVEYDRDNGKWYFLLGKNCRRLRRRHDSIGQPPSSQETLAFETAFSLSENVLFGVSLAQLYRESRNYTKANRIYEKIYHLQPTCCKVRLQLALGFIRAKQCELAKNCLDYVAVKMPNSTIYTHYMGIYEEKCNKNYKAAVPYYRRTTEDLNWSAERQYMECRKIVEPDWDPLPYLLDLLKKYETCINYKRQEINIQIGFYYLFEMHDLFSACPYLTKAIEILPDAKRLRDYIPLFRRSMRVNLYHVLAKEVQFALEVGAAVYDDDKITVLKNVLELCRKNCLDLPAPAVLSRLQASRSQMSSSYRNDNRGSSSRAEINWREDRPSSSFRGYSRYENSTRWSDGPSSPSRPSGSFQQRDYTSWRSDKQAD